VLTVFDVGHEGERTYLVFELLVGSTLAEVMKDGGLRTREALYYAAQVARGLAAAHARGIVHAT
jgi:serine/threonine-protein kinase